MTAASGAKLDAALADLGWLDMLDEMPDMAIPLVFRLLGETGAHAPVLNDVVLHAAGMRPGGTMPLPFAGGSWVVWERTDRLQFGARRDCRYTVCRKEIRAARAAAGRRALGWWLVGTSRAMLSLARQHALDRVQFGRPHQLVPGGPAPAGRDTRRDRGRRGHPAPPRRPTTRRPGRLLAKAAAGQAALTAARHCQQVLGGIGFTAEHQLHHHVKRALVLDGLLGSARELTREAGATLRAKGSAPRLASCSGGR